MIHWLPCRWCGRNALNEHDVCDYCGRHQSNLISIRELREPTLVEIAEDVL